LNSDKTNTSAAVSSPGYHIVAKPIGPACNLNCTYCFYLEKQAFFREDESCRMSDEVLSAYIRSYIESQPTPEVEFVWQGGEPTLLGLDFFRRVVELQSLYINKKIVKNSLQTNGSLLNDDWCLFLKEHNFMVGISMDGPREIHDRYRTDKRGSGSFDVVMRGLKLLQKHVVDYNVMVSVAKETANHPLSVYRFFREQGVEFLQFVPIIERTPGPIERQAGLSLGGPAALDKVDTHQKVTDWSVSPEAYGDFLIAIYEEWVRNDVGTLFVMNFEWALSAWIWQESPVCIHAKQCGRSVVLEHNGDVYACDHYVYSQYRLGNVVSDDLVAMIDASLKSGFGECKEKSLPQCCQDCEVLVACRGGCPKYRFAQSPQGEPGLHYLCAGYKKFFMHIRKYLRAMTTLLEHGFPASEVMKAIDGPLVINLESKKSPHRRINNATRRK